MKWILKNTQNNVKLTCETRVQAMRWYKIWLKTNDRKYLKLTQEDT